MTFGNMRANGVHYLRVYCAGRLCHHQASISADYFADDPFVVDLGRRMVCTVCGAIGVETMPDWNRRVANFVGNIGDAQ